MPSGLRKKKISMNRCASLRWKGLYIEADCDALWCQQTYKCVGPDGQLVDEFECSPARKCYEQL